MTKKIQMIIKKHLTTDKGHCSLETDERMDSFREKMSSGWDEVEYEKYRYDWEELSKKGIVRKYPLQLDVEMSSACNLNCPMCYTITDDFKNKVNVKLMDVNLYKRIIDEVAGEIYALRLSWRGESTLHPRLLEAVEYAKDKGIKEISFLTNGSKLSLDYFIKLANAGVTWITISIDGMDDVYNSIRVPLKFDEILKKVEDISNYKNDHGLVKPVIKIQSVWPAIRDNVESYYNLFEPITDMIAFNPIIDNLGVDDDIEYEDNFSCSKLYQRIFVSADGLAYMCNCDEQGKHPIGNVLNESIYDIWHGDELNSVRGIHKEHNGYLKMEICRECFYPRKTKITEVAFVNDRKILIENYTNRKQGIGE